MITVDVEYVTIPERETKTQTVTIDGNELGITPLIKVLTGLDVTEYSRSLMDYRHSYGDDNYWKYVKGQEFAKYTATLEFVKLRIRGDEVIIGNPNKTSGFGGEKTPSGMTFMRSFELKEVVIEARSCKIGRRAFEGCRSLERIELPEGTSVIGEQSFEYCESLKSIKIPRDTRRIEMLAFAHCVSLENLELPDGLDCIDSHAFEDCRSLRSVAFPSQSIEIGTCAFAGSGLRAVVLPDSVTKIGHNAFSKCESLEYAYMPSGVKEGIGLSSYPYSSLYPFSDCNENLLVMVSDEIDSNGKCHGYAATPGSTTGVQQIFHLRMTDPACQSAVKRIVDMAPIAGRVSGKRFEANNAESMQQYLKLIVEAETQVLQLSEMLIQSRSSKARLETALERRAGFDAVRTSLMEEAERRAWGERRKAILEGKRLPIGIKTGRPEKDPRLEPEPVMPEKPVLKKPGLFNKKKVEAQNAEAEAQYKAALADYEAELTARNAAIESFDAALLAWEELKSSTIRQQLSELGEFKGADSITTPRIGGSDDVLPELESSLATMEAMCSELESKLTESSGLLKLAYSIDVIFPKYRSLEAMSTIYEYFVTGRCTSLQGPSGAYNLYESEVRSRAIVSKLDVVVDKLDSISDQLKRIESNQYTLYQAVEGVAARLDSMSNTLDSVLAETRATRSMTQTLSARAAELVKNSSEIAYWSKKNAELTDSLGYLIAFTA